jgi:predicted nucleic acid-binding protein
MHQRSLFRKVAPTIPAGVLAEVYRGRNPFLDRFIDGCEIEPLTEVRAKLVGQLLAKCKLNVGVVDASVVEGALRRNDAVVTSNVTHIEALAASIGRKIAVVPI